MCTPHMTLGSFGNLNCICYSCLYKHAKVCIASVYKHEFVSSLPPASLPSSVVILLLRRGAKADALDADGKVCT